MRLNLILNMKRISFAPLFHREQEWIALLFQKDREINKLVRSFPKARWTQTHGCWYIPMEEVLFKEALRILKPVAEIETTALKAYLGSRKKEDPLPGTPQAGKPPVLPHLPEEVRPMLVYKQLRIHSVNAHVLPAMRERLQLKGYSSSTVRTYLNEMAQLLKVLKDIPADELTTAHLKRYLVYCSEQGLKENTLHSRMNALKFYYEQVLKREKLFWDIPRPKKQLILPRVLSDAEIGRLFRSVRNLKHKAILFTAYSAGLRVSEVVKLKLKDVDSSRMTLFIERAKGKKDRVVNLSPLLLDILRAYLRQSKSRPEVYLFEGDIAGEPYSTRSAQLIFSEARKNAGISKQVSFHALRHSFATHLLEKGVDIRYIKDILGHFNIKTTERYTHVSRRSLVNIISPLDDLFSRGIL